MNAAFPLVPTQSDFERQLHKVYQGRVLVFFSSIYYYFVTMSGDYYVNGGLFMLIVEVEAVGKREDDG